LLHLAFNDLSYFVKVMACCSPLGEFVAASTVAEVKDLNVVDDLVEMA
jgi:hypothetical protein